ncbi:hypothetical protein QUF56_20280 [Ureibacillus composti]|nr:hypothetical protein [Ureibacillus composti]
MRYLYLTIYLICTLFSIVAFALTNYSTIPPDAYAGGNGNLGIIPVVFGMPFILFFIVLTIIYAYQWMFHNLDVKKMAIISTISLLGIAIISIITWIKAERMVALLKEVHPIYSEVDDVPMLSINSNAVFFNIWTFIAVILLCSLISSLMARKDRVKILNKKGG